MTANYSESVPVWSRSRHIPVEELARMQGIKPIESVDELAHDGIFESDEELDEFLADLYASRRAGLA